MTIVIYCDVCGRACGDNSVVETTMDVAVFDKNPMHVCHARDGGDVGCIGFLRAGFRHAQGLAAAKLEERNERVVPR